MALELIYFVLKPTSRSRHHALASIIALRAYADAIENTDTVLAEDLREWAHNAERDLVRRD